MIYIPKLEIIIMRYKFIILLFCILFVSSLIYILPILAADFDASSTPSDVESGASNQELNFTISNTDAEFNITNVNITLPGGFYFITGSNSTSASGTLFSNTSNVLIWDNTTASQAGFILNGTVDYFLFNVSVPSGTGSFNFTVDILDTNATSNTKNVTITVSDNTDPSDIVNVSPTLGNNSYINVSWFYVNVTFTELNPDTCLLDLNNGTAVNYTMTRTGNYCYLNATSQGDGNWNYSVWVNDTSGNLGWNGTWFITVDVTAPSIDNVTNSTVTASTAIIVWNTSESSTSVVYYGTNQSALSTNVTNSSLTTEHSATLTSLSMKTTYYYNVSSCDAVNNCNTSGTYNFTTSCTESWSCGVWSACASGLQTRTCTDSNNCGTTTNKPSESQTCSRRWWWTSTRTSTKSETYLG